MKQQDGTPQWMTASQAARRLGLSRQALYRLIDGGRLPAYRFGRVIRLLVADVDAYADAHPGDR